MAKDLKFFVAVLLNALILLLPSFPDSAVSVNELVPLWKYAAGGELISPPVVADNIYLYSEDRQIHAVSSDGLLLWKFRLSGHPSDSFALGRDGTVYASTLEGRLYAINQGGSELWSLDLDSEPSGAASVSADGTVFIASASGLLYAVSHRGFIRWETDVGSSIIGAPLIDDGEAVYIKTGDGRLKSYTPWGTPRWEILISDNNRFSDMNAAVYEHKIYVTSGSVLESVSREGLSLWKTGLKSVCRGLVVFKNGLFLSFDDGSVSALSFSGEPLWIGEGENYMSYPVAGGEHLFMIDKNNRGHSSLVIMDFNGKVEGRGMVEGVNLTQPVIGNEILICGSEQWVACAFKLSDSDGRGWSQRGGGASHSGSSGIGRWQFNEADYLKNMDYLYLREYINSGSAGDKLKAVNEIGMRIAAEGTDRGERYLLHLLHQALTEGNRRLSANQPSAASDYPAVRREAARLIGLYGNFESVELLATVLDEEKHYDVSAAIMHALGTLGTDFDNLPQFSIYNKVRKDNNGSAYDGLAAAAIDAVAKITGYSGVPGSGYGYRTLMEIYRGHYSSAIRKQAGEVLRSLR